MSEIKVRENESIDSALRRFKRQTSRDGVIKEVRKREHYEIYRLQGAPAAGFFLR